MLFGTLPRVKSVKKFTTLHCPGIMASEKCYLFFINQIWVIRGRTYWNFGNHIFIKSLWSLHRGFLLVQWSLSGVLLESGVSMNFPWSLNEVKTKKQIFEKLKLKKSQISGKINRNSSKISQLSRKVKHQAQLVKYHAKWVKSHTKGAKCLARQAKFNLEKVYPLIVKTCQKKLSSQKVPVLKEIKTNKKVPDTSYLFWR